MQTPVMPIMIPVGYRFAPTDEELIKNYLANKVLYQPVPAKIIQEIHATSLFREPPNSLVQTVENKSSSSCEREWFFFVYQDECFRGEIKQIREIQNGVGFWRCIGGEEPIYNSKGDILAFKIHLTYFTGTSPNAKKTYWRMEEYRLQRGLHADTEAEWILGRIFKGRDYKSQYL